MSRRHCRAGSRPRRFAAPPCSSPAACATTGGANGTPSSPRWADVAGALPAPSAARSARSPTRSGSGSGTSPTSTGSTTSATAGGSCASTPASPLVAIGILALGMAGVDRRLQRRLADPAAAAALSRARIASSRCGSGNRRRRAGSTSRPATSSTGASARRRSQYAGRRRAVQPRLLRTASGPKCGGCCNVTEGFFESFGQPPLARPHVRARGVREGPAPGGRHQRQRCGDRASPPTPRRSGGASRSTASRGRSPA